MHDDFVAFGIKFAELCTAFGESQSKERIDLYWSRLRSFPIESVNRAIDHVIDHSRFFPKVAEIRELIEGSADDRASRAWSLLNDAIDAGGYYHSLFVEDPAMAAAIERTWGGWIEVNVPPVNDPMNASIRKQFCNHYRAAMQAGGNPVRYFAGFHESQNRQSVGSWRADRPTLPQKVVIVSGDRVFKRDLDFDCQTGRLTAESRRALEAGLTPLPAPRINRYLPEPVDPDAPVNPDDVRKVQAIISRLSGRKSMPQE